MKNDFKQLEFKHRRNDVLGAMHGHLTEDACFLAMDDISKKQDVLFNELEQLHNDELATTVSEKMDFLSKKCNNIQEFTWMVYVLGQISTANQISSGIIKIAMDGKPPTKEG